MYGAGYFNPDYFSPSYFGTEEGTAGAAAGTAYGSSTATATATARTVIRRGGRKKRRTVYAPIVITRAAGRAVSQARVSAVASGRLVGVQVAANAIAAGASTVSATVAWIDHAALQNQRDAQDMQDIRDITDILMLIAA
jgi:hypothetical protein